MYGSAVGVLSVLGVSESEEKVYEAVASTGSATPREIAERAGLTSRVTLSALQALRGKGLVAVHVGQQQRWGLTPPEPAFDALVHEQQQALAQVRTRAQQLTEQVRAQSARRRPDELVALAEGADAMTAHFEQLQRLAQKEVNVFDLPPYPSTGGATPNALQVERISAGVAYRVLYDHCVLDNPALVARIRVDIENGEQARVMPGVPLKLAIADRTMALVPLTDAATDPSTLVIRPSVLLDSLAALFDALWQRAIPLRLDATTQPDVDRDHIEIIQLLAIGMSDSRIARHLHTSDRTVRRRIAAAMQALGAETRFQAGMLALQKGWLNP